MTKKTEVKKIHQEGQARETRGKEGEEYAA